RAGTTFTAFLALATVVTFGRTTLVCSGIVLEHFALEHPNLDADDAVRGLGFGSAVVNISAQRVQRNATFAVPFGTSDIGTTQTATNVHADAAGAHADRRLHGALHGATESHAAFELLGDALGNQRRIGFGLPHFNDVDVHFAVGELLHLGADLVDVSALLADHDARTSGVDRHAALAVRTLDDDLGNRSGLQIFHEHGAVLEVFLQQRSIFALVGEPAAVPGAVDAEAEADRIDFLAHYAASSTCRTTIVRCEKGFSTRADRPRPRAWKRFMTRELPTKASATTRASVSRPWLFSALAMALSSTFFTWPEMRLWLNSRSAKAFSTFLPRINCARRFNFWGLMLSMRSTALASLSLSARWVFGLPILLPLGLLVGHVAVIGTARRELAKLVADQVLGRVVRDMLLTVVNAERDTHELRQDGRTAAPDLDHIVAAGREGLFGLLEHV